MKITQEQLNQIDCILGYLHESEEKNYEEHVYNDGDPKNHIFNVVLSLEKSLNLG